MNITELIQQYKDKDFSWGTVDCCIFAVELAEQLSTKPLHMSNWRDLVTYTDIKESDKTVKEFGADGIKDLPGIVLGTSRKNISEVQHGDIVYMEDENGFGALGICNGVRAYFMTKPKGLTARMVEDCIYCWSINK